ncbi:murein DD-endopeptidase MepM/ murein hydrolase activator NlpD [Haloferula luteola]|uniref:Murein DD-endopeptidase MepM/ murein hydrolase activator NlpD n=1 Tax=Haloferula luteola TaxID=595692 RepID=A0A840UUP0_9BACT|nr:M23 family metallopeptidase [Haloferula luteola]MBB5349917.1 murein DD-endopeptidase MepM/ murein hydrolase activator NlpD [Haloferula luteola]
MLRLLFVLLGLAIAAPAVTYSLPTENDHLFRNEPDKFYMWVDRTFEGETTRPWEGGGWGLVRTPVRVDGKVFMLRFHEGIDIAPVKRDKAGNPLDLVMSVADGTVVHVSDVPGRSNYGRYIVVSHPISPQGHAVFSLYAHLAKATVQPGDPVKMGSVLGQMGYTGVGINRTRAHVHLEMGLLMSDHFDGWFKRYCGGTNYHGNYNGMNLIGMDVAKFLLAHHANPTLTIPAFVRSEPAYFKVTVPRKGTLEFAERHPWLAYGDLTAPSPSWEISFTSTGLPTGIATCQREVSRPIVSAVRDSGDPHRYPTRGLLTGKGSSAQLTDSGLKFVSLVTGSFAQP